MDIEVILNGKYTEIEKQHAKECMSIGWGSHTDVLYSFKALFAAGVFIFGPDKSKYRGSTCKYINIDGQRQRLWSQNYLSILYTEHRGSRWMKALCKAIQPLADVYDSIGNLFPVYPGGNQYKGSCGCLDMPDIFFHNRDIRSLEEYYTSQILGTDPLLSDVFDHPLVTVPKELFSLSEKEYEKLISSIVKRIRSREGRLRELLKQPNT